MLNELKISDFVNSIVHTGEYLGDHEDFDKVYSIFLVVKNLAKYPDICPYLQAFNFAVSKSNWKKGHYDALFHAVPKRKRKGHNASKKKSSFTNEQLEAVKKYYGYSNGHAISALEILTPYQLYQIMNSMNIGGKL